MKYIKNTLLLLVILAGLISVTKGVYNSLSSSKDYQWSGSKVLLNGNNPYENYLDPDKRQKAYILTQAPNYSIWGYPLIWPYAQLDWFGAKVAWAITNIILSILVFVLLLNLATVKIPNKMAILIFFFFLASTPLRTTISNGQHGLFVLFLFVLSVAQSKKNNLTLSAIPLAFSWFKYSITFPLNLFFMKDISGIKILILSVGICLFSTLIISYYIDSNFIQLLIGPILVASQSTGIGHLDTFAVAVNLGVQGKVIPIVASIILMILSFYAIKRTNDTLTQLAILSSLACCTVFHLHYDMVLLIVPLVCCISQNQKNKSDYIMIIMVLYMWILDRIFQTLYGFIISDKVVYDSLMFWQRAIVFYGAFLYFTYSQSFKPGSRRFFSFSSRTGKK